MPAQYLYKSDWFKKASAYARQNSDEWYILSAKYGLLSPDTVISYYEKACKDMRIKERRIWAANVVRDLRSILSPGCRVLILAGHCYREFIIEPIQQMGCEVKIPMEGLRSGEQLSWLLKHSG